MEGQFEWALIVLGLVICFVACTIRSLDTFDPYAHLAPGRDLYCARCTEFKKLLIAVRYEQWSNVLEKATRFNNLALSFVFYMCVVLAVQVETGKAAMKSAGFVTLSILPLIAAAVVAAIQYKLRLMARDLQA